MSSRELGRAARRLHDRQANRLNELPRESQLAEVVSVTSAGVTTVRWRGSDVVAAGKNALYTPAVGDWCMCRLFQSRLFIDYPIDGQP